MFFLTVSAYLGERQNVWGEVQALSLQILSPLITSSCFKNSFNVEECEKWWNGGFFITYLEKVCSI